MDERKTIMVVDDEKDFTFFLKSNLERLGCYRVLVFNDGSDACRQAERHRPDLILLDITMPRVTGFEVLEQLKANYRTAAIPVVMLTARTDLESKEAAARRYNEDFISKPVEVDHLRRVIDKVIGRRIAFKG